MFEYTGTIFSIDHASISISLVFHSVRLRYARWFVVVVGETAHLFIAFFVRQLPFIGQSPFFLQLHDGVDLGSFLLT